jgi:hypothetical protein
LTQLRFELSSQFVITAVVTKVDIDCKSYQPPCCERSKEAFVACFPSD